MSTFNSRREAKRSKGRAPKNAAQAARILASAELQSQQSGRKPASNSILKQIVGLSALFFASLLIFMVGITPLIHIVNQNNLRSLFREQLAAAVAPTGEADYNKVILAQGAPVAIIQIPKLGVSEVVVEGTDSGSLTLGVGHRRDTVLPGQQGVSILMGRSSSYGGPFNALQRLQPGDLIKVVTGQGLQKFEVLGVRNAGDFSLPAVSANESRLVLVTSRGAPFYPTGVQRLDAKLISAVQPAGPRVSSIFSVPIQEREMGFDSRFAWALVFALQFLLISILLFMWARNRFDVRRAYLVFTPMILLADFLVMDQIVKFLPNLL
jgi:sortase A